jgi:Mg-chelatase subunit ChlD
MIRLLSLLVVVGMVFGVSSWIVAQSDSGAVAKRPLDLPSGGAGDDDDEEDSPEAITFYGTEYEGDGFFWCLDKSGSMVWGGRINILKQEMSAAIGSLTSRAEFGLVAFSTNFITWQQRPVKASTAMKASATGWVNTISAAGWTCLLEAGIKTVDIANQSPKQKKQIIILSDGVPTCFGQDTSAQCLSGITGANWQRIPVNTIYISTDAAGISFMQQLAAANGGIFSTAQ